MQMRARYAHRSSYSTVQNIFHSGWALMRTHGSEASFRPRNARRNTPQAPASAVRAVHPRPPRCCGNATGITPPGLLQSCQQQPTEPPEMADEEGVVDPRAKRGAPTPWIAEAMVTLLAVNAASMRSSSTPHNNGESGETGLRCQAGRARKHAPWIT